MAPVNLRRAAPGSRLRRRIDAPKEKSASDSEKESVGDSSADGEDAESVSEVEDLIPKDPKRREFDLKDVPLGVDMSSLEEDLDNEDASIVSLPKLQYLIKRDPEAYEPNWLAQVHRFQGLVAVFKENPRRPADEFNFLTAFLSNTSGEYPDNEMSKAFSDTLVTLLQTFVNDMNHDSREAIMHGLSLLQKTGLFPMRDVLPLWFSIISSKDKILRRIVYNCIVRDIQNLWTKTRDFATHDELKTYLIANIEDVNHVQVQRKSLGLLIEMHRRNIWRDAKTVNGIVKGLLMKDARCMGAAAGYILGNREAAHDVVEDEETMAERVQGVAESIVFGKQTRAQRKSRKLDKMRAMAKKQIDRMDRKRRNIKLDSKASAAHVDLIYDPIGMVDTIFRRSKKNSDGLKLELRINLLNVCSRLIARHHLVYLNFYPFILGYLNPKRNTAHQVLAIIVESIHQDIPPMELAKIKDTILNTFVVETLGAELQVQGLNAVRNLMERNISLFTHDDVDSLAIYAKSKTKEVRMQGKSVINLLRTMAPALLHKRDRTASNNQEIRSGGGQANEFGYVSSRCTIPGLKYLLMKEKGTAEVTHSDEENAMRERVFSPKEFEAMRGLQTLVDQERFKGKRRIKLDNILEFSLSDDEYSSDGEVNHESSDEGDNPIIAEAVRDLREGLKKRKNLRSMSKREREGFLANEKFENQDSGKAQWKIDQKTKREAIREAGMSLPNHIVARNKPMMMVRQAGRLKSKAALDVRKRFAKPNKNFKGHTGGRNIQRR